MWLDQAGNQVGVSRRSAASEPEVVGAEQVGGEQEQFAPDEQLEERVFVDSKGGVLETSVLSYSMRVTREHHNQLFTCVARHKAFELLDELQRQRSSRKTPETVLGQQLQTGTENNNNNSSTSGQPIHLEENWLAEQLALHGVRSKSVRLEVNYEPVIELTKDRPHPAEGDSLLVSCRAHARPPVHGFRWFLDGRPIEGAAEAELFIGRLSRRLHARELRCQASNSLGSSSAILRLSVRYSPFYATHLLPASLQPPQIDEEPPSSGQLDPKLDPKLDEDQLKLAALWPPATPPEVAQSAQSQDSLRQQLWSSPTGSGLQAAGWQRALAAQLALSVGQTRDVTLRCDFDANPRPLQVDWFKLNTNWALMKDVPPEVADQLVAGGALHASFKRLSGGSLGATSGGLASTSGGVSAELSSGAGAHRRHIAVSAAASRRGQSQGQSQGQFQTQAAELQAVDYERMSAELLDELQRFEELRARQDGAELVGQAQAANNSNLAPNSPVSSWPGAPSAPEADRWPAGAYEQIVTEPAIQTPARIFEPLNFRLRTLVSGAPHADRSQVNGSSASDRLEAHFDLPHGHTHSLRRGLPLRELVLDDGQVGVASGSSPAELVAHSHTQQQQQRAGSLPATTPPSQVEPLVWRHAQLTSSSITLRQVDEDSVGKYVCRARAQDGFRWFARGLQLVLRQSPRIVSVREQRAPLGARQMQVECLVQLNGVLDNRTQFQWFRSDPKQAGHSPDSLAARHDKVSSLFPFFSSFCWQESLSGRMIVCRDLWPDELTLSEFCQLFTITHDYSRRKWMETV